MWSLIYCCCWTKPKVLCSSFLLQGSCCYLGRLGTPTQHPQRIQQLHQKSNVRDDDEKWKGEVVPDGTIRGCSVTPVTVSTTSTVTTEWIITIDGVEADLGRFSAAIYKQIMQQAKRERFQGFRPGTIPPHLMTTYRAFCMDECARETVLEAMQQNNIRPFTDARSQFVIEQVSIPPPEAKKGKVNVKINNQKKKPPRGGKNVQGQVTSIDEPIEQQAQEEGPSSKPSQWRYFDTMDGAIQAGWQPGQSFSFVAKNVKGQNVQSGKDVDGAKPLGRVWS
jgi:hypothetical protein